MLRRRTGSRRALPTRPIRRPTLESKARERRSTRRLRRPAGLRPAGSANGARADDGTKSPYFSLTRGIIRKERLFMPMRRLCLILLCGLVAVPAAYAAAGATGDGVLELRAVE